jgi:hypothetical protein
MVKTDGRHHPISAEPLWQWKREILWMQQAYELRDLACAVDREAISALVKEPVDDGSPFRWGVAKYARTLKREKFEMPATVDFPYDPLDAARFVVHEIANLRLEANTAYLMTYNQGTQRFENHVRPRNLLGALWLQLAESLNPSRQYRECPGCHQRFAVSLDTKRADAKYCSTKCRVAASQRRKRKAREMYASGMRVGAIAAALGSELKTVKGWVNAARPKTQRKAGAR